MKPSSVVDYLSIELELELAVVALMGTGLVVEIEAGDQQEVAEPLWSAMGTVVVETVDAVVVVVVEVVVSVGRGLEPSTEAVEQEQLGSEQVELVLAETDTVVERSLLALVVAPAAVEPAFVAVLVVVDTVEVVVVSVKQ